MNADLTDDDVLLRRYLLGELAEEQRGKVEERLLADDDFFELAEAVEADLLAAFARNEVGPEERRKAIKKLARTRSGHARLALALALNRFGDAPETVTIAIPKQLPARRTEPAWFRPAMVRVATLAASFAAAAFAVWMSQRPVSPTVDRISGAVPGHTQSAPAHLAPQPRPAQPVPEATAKLPAAPLQPAPPPVQQPAAQPASIVLQLALLSIPRDANAAAEPLPRLPIQTTVQNVELQVQLADEEPYRSYRITLSDAATSRDVWSGKAEIRTASGRPAVVANVPALQLPSGELDLKLTGIDGENEETIGWASFKVTRGHR